MDDLDPAQPLRKIICGKATMAMIRRCLAARQAGTDLRGGAVSDAAGIARRYSQGLKVERRVAATLEALARLGHVSIEREGYRLRRAA